MSGYFGGSGGGGGGYGSAIPYWWYDPYAFKIVDTFYGSNLIDAIEGYVTPALNNVTGVDGATGFGGISESRLISTCHYDGTPTQSVFAGMKATYILSAANPAMSQGAWLYCLSRFHVDGDQAFYIGWDSDVPNIESDANASVAFVKRRTDTNWQAARCDPGVGWSYTDTGVAWVATDWHAFEIEFVNNAGSYSALFYVDGVLVATVTTGLPASPTTFIPNLYHGSYFYSDGDTSTYDTINFDSRLKWYSKNSGKLISHIGYDA